MGVKLSRERCTEKTVT